MVEQNKGGAMKPMQTHPFSRCAARYSLAVAAVLATLLLRWALLPVLGSGTLYITLLPAVMIVAVTLGTGPVVLGTMLGVLLIEYSLIGPSGQISLTVSLAVRSAIMLLTALYVGRVGDKLRAARQRAEGEAAAARTAEAGLQQAKEHLEARVQERTAELKTANETVDAERRRFRDVLDRMPAYLVLLTPDHHVAFANRFFEERFGRANGRRCYEYLFQRTAPCETCETHSVLKTNAPHRWEWTGPDGRNYDIHDFPFADADGSPLIMEVGIDITEIKQAQAALQAERQRFLDVLETLPAMISLLTPDYHVAFANRSFREKFGESHGRHCYEYCYARTQPCEFCESYEVLKTGQPHHWEVTGPDGSVIDAYDFPFFDVDGSPMILEMDIDITERRKAEAELARHREHLDELIQERTAALAEANAQFRASNEELERFNRAMVGRELRMIELKQEVNALCAQAGQPPRYPLDFEKERP